MPLASGKCFFDGEFETFSCLCFICGKESVNDKQPWQGRSLAWLCEGGAEHAQGAAGVSWQVKVSEQMWPFLKCERNCGFCAGTYVGVRGWCGNC